ncbi:MAG: hypothetical protein SGILL_002113, partial [Bacillariaceae sp.]
SLDSHMGTQSETPTPVKRKRGRPPKIRPKEQDDDRAPLETSPSKTFQNRVKMEALQHSNKSHKMGQHPKDTPTQRKRSSSMGTSGHHRPIFMRTSSWTPPQEDLEGSFLNHTVTLAPILPPIVKHDNPVKKDETLSSSAAANVTTTTTRATNNSAIPVTIDDPQQYQALKAAYPAVFNEGGVPKACTAAVAPFSGQGATSAATSSKNQQQQQPQLPTWTPLYTPPVYFEEDYDRDTGKLDVDSVMPVTRKITALTVRKPHHDYLALGDTAGFVLIYSLGKDTINRPVARLESVACQQRARQEQERLRAELQKKRPKTATKSSSRSGPNGASKQNGLALFSSYSAAPGRPQQASSILMDTSETTIQALGMIEDRVVLATSVELECMDIPSATSLWVCPLSPDRFVTSLDMHLRTFNVLVSCSKNVVEPAANAVPISSLMLLQHSKHNVEICDANSPMLVRSPSCTAIWDVGCDNRLLFVALSANRQELELVLVSGGSIDTWKVACKTKIPIKSSSASNLATSATKLSQSPRGEYTLVASSRGIRLYQTETLQLIHIYGDQLALHGQSVIWKDCWLAGSFFTESKGCHKSRKSSSLWLEVDDWLEESAKIERQNARRKKSGSNDKAVSSDAASDLAPYIVGVPHVKGPTELCQNLHVWKVEHASAVPALSIPLPRNAGGALGLAGGGSSLTGVDDRIILITNDGQGHALLPKMESNFAGIMYPPGYKVITDNIEFVEEEDALDKVVQYDDLSAVQNDSEDEEVNIFNQVEGDDMDEELKEAMRQSLLEHKRQEDARAAMKHDQDVDIVAQEKEDVDFLPCRPEPYLRQFIQTEEEDDVEQEAEHGMMEIEETKDTSNDTSEKDEMEEDVAKPAPAPGALFVSNVLEALPNTEKPKPVEDEDCLSFTTTKVVLAVNPVPIVPARPGRGRKSRAGNVEAMLKASINPYLQSIMMARQGVAVEGQGSRLRNIDVKAADALAKNSQGRLSHAYDASSDHAVPRSQSTPDPNPATSDEAAVALGLLGLSPNPSNATSKPLDVLASVTAPRVPGMSNASNDPKNASGRHGSAYLSASSLSSIAARAGAEAQFANTMKLPSSNAGTAESLTASSDKESTAEESDGGHVVKAKLHAVDKTCNACRGRFVVHSCGKRSLPIDYDEVAKAERERKEKEEEEKKRARAEKRRLADQRRREAKKQKQKELEEQRLREEEEERLERERQTRLQEDFESQDLNRNRHDQIVASYAQYQDQGSLGMTSVDYSRPRNDAPPQPPAKPQVANGFETVSIPQAVSHFEELSRPRVGSIFEQASRMMEEAAPRHEAIKSRPASAGEAAAVFQKASAGAVDAAAHTNGPAPKQQTYVSAAPLAASTASAPAAVAQRLHLSAPSASALEALDGLAALASLAGATSAAAPLPAASNTTASFSYAASHGFGSASLEEAKRAIPSFAAIRGQVNGGSDTAANGGNWPPRREG